MRLLLTALAALVLLFGCIQMPGQSQAGQGSGGTATPPQGAQDSSGPAGGAASGDGDAGAEEAASGGTQGTEPAAADDGAGDDQGEGESADEGQAGTQGPQTSIPNRDVSYKSGAWVIYGTIYESQSKSPTHAVILLPELGKARDSYPVSFIESLHAQLPDAVVLALDLRGHGESTNLGTYDEFVSADFRDMKTDVLNAKPFLQKEYPNVEEFYLVGASIGSSAAILAGVQEKTFHKVVMISPGMDYQGVDIERAAEDYQFDVLAAASSGDAYSFQSANTIRSLRSARTVVKSYPGSAHGAGLFASSEGESEPLSAAIVEFLK